MRIILITGTPGTGKTTLSKSIAAYAGYRHIDISKMIKGKKLGITDENRGCEAVSIDRLSREVSSEIEHVFEEGYRGAVIDSHMSHLLGIKADICIIARCPLNELKKRLEARGYRTSKVQENMDAEIFDTCLSEAKEEGYEITIADTSSKTDMKKVVSKVLDKLHI